MDFSRYGESFHRVSSKTRLGDTAPTDGTQGNRPSRAPAWQAVRAA
jgi:hypothetical protein